MLDPQQPVDDGFHKPDPIVKGGEVATPPPKPQAAPETFIPQPKSPPEPVVVPAFYRSQYQAAIYTLVCLPFLLWLTWLMARLRLRFITLDQRKRQGNEKVRLESLPFKLNQTDLFPSSALKPVWHAWRRFQPFRSRRLHKAKTVRTTLQNHGFFTPIYRDRMLPPEYVVLIDRRHYEDFSARLGQSFAERAQAEGLFVSRYFYDSTPDICWKPEAAGRVYRLKQLADRHLGQHLIVLGEAQSFFQAHRGKTIALGDVGAWASKILLSTNTPQDWSASEQALAQIGFTVSPFTRRGIHHLLTQAKKTRTSSEPMTSLDFRDIPLPRALPASNAVWQINRKPAKALQQGMITALKEYLGEAGYCLLTAIAAYPAVHWQLTLALDSQLGLASDEQREIRLRKLVRLPWFRFGQLPQVWRRILICSLPQYQLDDISRCYQALMNIDRRANELIELPVAIPDLSNAQREQNEILNSARHGDPLQDMVFASVLRGRKPKITEFTPPHTVKRWFPPEYWRGIFLPALLGLAIASASSVAAWLAWRQWGQALIDQQAGQRMHDDLGRYTVNVLYEDQALAAHAQNLQKQLQTWGFNALTVENPQVAAIVLSKQSKGNSGNQLITPDQFPARIKTLIEERLQYLTYHANVHTEVDLGLPADLVNIVLRKAYEPKAVYRDAIQSEHMIEPGPSMVSIPEGVFQMGSENGESDEKPVHQVNIKSFAIGRYEVTFDEYDQYVAATGAATPDDQGWGRGKRPVIEVNWEDANAYAKWLSAKTGQHYRLPTEAEWEYAARANTSGDYYWGDGDAGDFAWFKGNSNNQTHPVGAKKPNEFGLYDVSGNAREWVQDCFVQGYKSAHADGSVMNENDCSGRVVRGGSWAGGPSFQRSAFRDWFFANDRSINIGFRLAQDLH
jgi:formylglycine-generating enzyme required for sulfatase activity